MKETNCMLVLISLSTYVACETYIYNWCWDINIFKVIGEQLSQPVVMLVECITLTNGSYRFNGTLDTNHDSVGQMHYRTGHGHASYLGINQVENISLDKS